MQPSLSTPTRASTKRVNATHSTGPRSERGRQRSSLNAITHGLTARVPTLPAEDPAAYQRHCRQLHDEHQPATPTETQLVQELADTARRLNRIPLLEADLLARHTRIMDSHRALAALGMHSQRLSRQFHKTLDQLRASNPTAAPAKPAISSMPPASSSSTNTQESQMIRANMASFFRKAKSKPTAAA